MPQNKVDQNLNGKVAWITGASSGIGEALAYAMGRQGAELVLSSNEDDELDRVKNNCLDMGFKAEALHLDLIKPDEMPAKTEFVVSKFGGIDILVNNGGISQRSLARETGLDVDKKILEIDYFGHIALTKAVLPYMVRKKSGHIVVTTSVAGKVGFPYRTAYCGAKHALHGFFDSLRTEIRPHNILVTLIVPAAVKTRIDFNALTGNGAAFDRRDKEIGAGISPEECAQKIIKAIIKEKEEILIGGGPGRLAVRVHRLSPRLYSYLMKKVEVAL